MLIRSPYRCPKRQLVSWVVLIGRSHFKHYLFVLLRADCNTLKALRCVHCITPMCPSIALINCTETSTPARKILYHRKAFSFSWASALGYPLWVQSCSPKFWGKVSIYSERHVIDLFFIYFCASAGWASEKQVEIRSWTLTKLTVCDLFSDTNNTPVPRVWISKVAIENAFTSHYKTVF